MAEQQEIGVPPLMVDRVAQALVTVDFVLFAIAEEASEVEASQSWREMTWPEDYDAEQLRGKRYTTFRKFLTGLAWELRHRGHQLTADRLERWVRVFRWLTALGASKEQASFLTMRVCEDLFEYHDGLVTDEVHESFNAAWTEKLTYGRYFTPKKPVRGDVPRYFVETIHNVGSKTYTVKALGAWRGDQKQRNVLDEGALHLLCKRLRAENVILAEDDS